MTLLEWGRKVLLLAIIPVPLCPGPCYVKSHIVTHVDFRKVLAVTQVKSHEHLRIDTQFYYVY